MHSVDIVIPSAGRPEALLKLLASLYRYSLAEPLPHPVTVTVSDDRHSPLLGQRLASQYPAVRYIAGPARGPAANRNHAAAQGQGTWLLFLDDDCFLDCDVLGAYRQGQKAAARAGLSPAEARTAPRPRVLEGAVLASGARPSGQHHSPVNASGGYLMSGNFMIERGLFESLGGFDERFPYSLEDCDFLWRLRQQGETVRFVPQAAVRHPWRRVALPELWRQAVGHAVMADKHPMFAGQWGLINVLRMQRGRIRQYASPDLLAIPPRQWLAALCDFLSPVAMALVVRTPPLRRAVLQHQAQLKAGRGA